MQLAADMEEEGIEWVLASRSQSCHRDFPPKLSSSPADKKLGLASQHSNGKPTIDINMGEALREKYRFDQAGLGDLVTACDNSNAETQEES
jgi:hypothetical protein